MGKTVQIGYAPKFGLLPHTTELTEANCAFTGPWGSDVQLMPLRLLCCRYNVCCVLVRARVCVELSL